MKFKKFVISVFNFFVWPGFLFKKVIKGDKGFRYEDLGVFFLSFGLSCPVVSILFWIEFNLDFWLVFKIGLLSYLAIGLVALFIIKREFEESFFSNG